MRYIELASILTIFGVIVRAQISTPVNLDDVIKKYQLQLSDYPEVPPIDSNVECTGDHVSSIAYHLTDGKFTDKLLGRLGRRLCHD